jgi:UDP-N-acetylglucosamine--N-acetylmuramyl-(pentapeptide) pyrophosphoryl-undecaprenol N-acetylglucosamine transferase
MALRLYESFQPSAVIGFGGYPALPALLAAAAGIPSLVHEQNAVFGRVNRFLAGRVQVIATAYGQVDRLNPSWPTRCMWWAIRCGPRFWRCATARSRISARTACCACW